VITLPAYGAAGSLQLASAPDGYAYRLGTADWLTIGWVGPARPPRIGAQLRQRITSAGAGWVLDDVAIADSCPTHRRPASAALPHPGAAAIPIGDAALARDALASQGLSIGLSDSCLVADPSVDRATMADRHRDALTRHLRHLHQTILDCRHRDQPCWSDYLDWLAARSAPGPVPVDADPVPVGAAPGRPVVSHTSPKPE
jgi:hypothetical protein